MYESLYPPIRLTAYSTYFYLLFSRTANSR
nr:MAG TPA: hypothetical protein [Caudoviricetes sp.]